MLTNFSRLLLKPDTEQRREMSGDQIAEKTRAFTQPLARWPVRTSGAQGKVEDEGGFLASPCNLIEMLRREGGEIQKNLGFQATKRRSPL